MLSIYWTNNSVTRSIVRSGRINYANAYAVGYSGRISAYLASLASTINYGYWLDIDSGQVIPSNGWDGDRYGGFSLRCLAS